MLKEQEIMSALAVERRMYMILSELVEITSELSDALQWQDQVSFQLYLSMRQESINQLRDNKEILRKQCKSLSQEDGNALREILSGTGVPNSPNEQKLCEQVQKNRGLLDRIIQADRLVSRRLGGKKSFYSQQP